jgi:hypothetical protein
VFVFVSAAALFHSIGFALLASALLFVNIADSLIPLTYRLDEKGAHVCALGIAWLEMSWDEVRAVVCTRRGVKLSPFENPANARSDSWRGIELPFQPQDDAQIWRAISHYRRLEAQEINKAHDS